MSCHTSQRVHSSAGLMFSLKEGIMWAVALEINVKRTNKQATFKACQTDGQICGKSDLAE